MKIHMVKKGDTLFILAQKYKVELDNLIAFNPQIQDPNQIDVGMKVKIPTHPQPVEPPSSEYAHKHIVEQGDTLWKLGKAWDVSLQAMIKTNPQLKNPNVLMTGEIVYIPKHSTDLELGNLETKPSTEPMMTSMPMNQPTYPVMPQEELPIHTPEFDLSSSLKAGLDWMHPAESVPLKELPTYEEPSWNLPQQPIQEASSPDISLPDLHMPYPQAQHPFKEFHIKATEVSAYPAPMEYSDAPAMPNIPPGPQTYQMPQMYGGPQEFPAYPQFQGQPGYSDGGCGCGGESFALPGMQPWDAYPPYTSMAMPYTHYPPQPLSAPYPYEMMPAPCYPVSGEFQPGFPYDGMQPGFPYDGMQHGFPYDGMQHGMHPAMQPGMHPAMSLPYPTPYEPAHLPGQANIHQWTGNVNIEEDMERDASENKSSSKTTSKPAGSSRKAKSSGKQQAREERIEPKPNLPWINV